MRGLPETELPIEWVLEGVGYSECWSFELRRVLNCVVYQYSGSKTTLLAISTDGESLSARIIEGGDKLCPEPQSYSILPIGVIL